MEIVQYHEKYLQEFIDLNTAWVEKYFVMEQVDRDTLYHAEEYMKKGGMIYFAIEGEKVFATCMVFPHGNDIWEITKLATNEKYQGRGTGSAVFKACMDYATKHGAKRIVLETNQILKPAQHIYEKFGFARVSLDPNSKYSRADMRFEYTVT